MAQTRPQPASIQAAFEEQVKKLYETFLNAFSSAGYSKLFTAYWESISPLVFPCDDFAVINKYYKSQQERIPHILEFHGCLEMAIDKKIILKTLSDLCHSLARIKYVIERLKLLPSPVIFSSACRSVHTQLTCEIVLNPLDGRQVEHEIGKLEQYFYLVSIKLKNIGYFKGNLLFDKPRRDQADLPAALRTDLERLKDNNELNRLIDPLETAIKTNKNTQSHCAAISAEMELMSQVNMQLQEQTDNTFDQFRLVAERVNREKERLIDLLVPLQGYEYIFQLNQVQEVLQNTIACPSLKTTINTISPFCSRLATYTSTLTRGMVSDPWVEAYTAANALTLLEKHLDECFNAYTDGLHLQHLLSQYNLLKQRQHGMQQLSLRIQKLSENALLTDRACHEAIEQTILVLSGHIHSVDSDSYFGFAGRHWGKIIGGGLTGGAAAVAIIAVTTNPILLAGCVVAGAAIGTAGGTGTGLAQDAIFGKKAKKKEEQTAQLTTNSYGAMWHTAASAAAAATTTTENAANIALHK